MLKLFVFAVCLIPTACLAQDDNIEGTWVGQNGLGTTTLIVDWTDLDHDPLTITIDDQQVLQGPGPDGEPIDEWVPYNNPVCDFPSDGGDHGIKIQFGPTVTRGFRLSMLEGGRTTYRVPSEHPDSPDGPCIVRFWDGDILVGIVTINNPNQ